MAIGPSKTAEVAAAFRARETRKPEAERVCSDVLARQFIGPFYLALGRHAWLGAIFNWLGERQLPGLAGAVVARTRFFDERTGDCLANGIRQVVILGAGYDTRAYRLGDAKRGVHFYEVDHPATQAVKTARLRDVLGSLPGHVTYVAADLGRESLDRRLEGTGYDPARRTVFIWEGVSYYLSAAAVDATLAFMARNSATGSTLLFDVLPRAVADGTSTRRDAVTLHRRLQKRGEPLLFGLDDDEVVPFLRERGFEALELVTAAACKDTWFHGANRNTPVSDIFRFVHAIRINGRADSTPGGLGPPIQQ